MKNLIRNIFQTLLPKKSATRHVGILVLGTAVAQAIPIAITPILTRLYSPEDFGIAAIYLACVSIITIIATARYEQAITLPKKDDDARHLFIFTLKLCLLISILLYIPIYLFGEKVAELLGRKDLAIWFYLLPLSVLAAGAFNLFKFWYNRISQYKKMTINQIQHASLTAISNTTFGIAHLNGGLIMGSVIGILGSSLLVGFKIFKDQKNFFYNSTFSAQLSLAKCYLRHPKYIAPSQLIGVIAQQIPIFLISSLFSLTILGYFSLAYRLISLPTVLVANAIGDVYRQKISVAYNARGEFKREFLTTLKKTTLVAAPPLLVLYFIAPDMFVLFFGETWRIAGEYAQILVIGSFFQFIFTPIDKGAIVVGKSTYIFIWHVLRLFGFALLFIFAGIYSFSIETILWSFVAINSTLYLFDGFMGYNFAKKTS
jgi:O-antigen/teichoic acid export membrane protein